MKRILIILTIYIVLVPVFATGSGLAFTGASSFLKGSSIVSSVSAYNQEYKGEASNLSTPDCPCHY